MIFYSKVSALWENVVRFVLSWRESFIASFRCP